METTTDRRLFDTDPTGASLSRERADRDSWRVLRIQSEFVAGFDALSDVSGAVTGFGSARTPRESAEYAQGVKLGAALAAAGYAVTTGGGPGSMEAANKGACEVGGQVTRFPIVLLGTAYWGGLIDWITTTMAVEGTVCAQDLSLLHVTDSVDETIAIIAESAAQRAGHAKTAR